MEHVRPRPSSARYPSAALPGSSSERRKAVSTHARRLATRSSTSSWKATRSPARRSAPARRSRRCSRRTARRERTRSRARRGPPGTARSRPARGPARHQVIGDGPGVVLVQVVADARPVGEQVLDGHAVVDQRQVGSEHRARGGRSSSSARPRPATDGQRGQALGAAGSGEAGCRARSGSPCRGAPGRTPGRTRVARPRRPAPRPRIRPLRRQPVERLGPGRPSGHRTGLTPVSGPAVDWDAMSTTSFVSGAFASVKQTRAQVHGRVGGQRGGGPGPVAGLNLGLHWYEPLANTVSVCISAVPAYYLSRAWVWGRSGKSHFKTEVLPFWIFIAIGLVFSTTMVAIVTNLTAGGSQTGIVHKFLPNIVNAASFFILWVSALLPLREALHHQSRAGRGAHGPRLRRGLRGPRSRGGGRGCRRRTAPARRLAAGSGRRLSRGRPMDPDRRALAESARGFMPPDEGVALYETGASVPSGGSPMLEIGSYCGKSAVYLGTAAEERSTILYSLDHHRGSEENQAGWEWHEPDLVDPEVGLMDTLPRFRRTIHDAGLEASVVAVVGDSPTVGRHWTIPLSLLFIDGGHGTEPAHRDFETGHPMSSRAGCWPSTTCSRIRPTAAARPTRSTAGPSTRARFAKCEPSGPCGSCAAG